MYSFYKIWSRTELPDKNVTIVRIPHLPLYCLSLQLTICSVNLQAVQEESMKKKVFCTYLLDCVTL